MSLEEIILRTATYSLFVVPIVVLVVGMILFFVKPVHRLTLGIIFVTLGGFGVLIYSFTLAMSLARGGVIVYYAGATVFVEIMTTIVGVISLIKSAKNAP